MSFSVISNTAVKSLLSGLTRTDVLAIQSTLNRTFVEYSVNNEAAYQPHRASVTRPDGSTTLFMPATSSTSVGSKIIGIPPATAKGKTLAGVLVLCDTEGNPRGILNASEVTGFRTALGSMTLLPRRERVSNVVVFGAGKQAFWHARLALLLRGSDVKSMTVVNRSAQRSEELVEQLRPFTSEVGASLAALNASDQGYDRSLKELVGAADVIFCTTPATSPLFPASYLDQAVERGEGPYIGAIGSYKPEMKELDPGLFQNVVTSKTGCHPKGGSGGVIVVDTKEGAFQEAGEIIQGKIPSENIVEIGELLHIQKNKEAQDPSLDRWLTNGFIIYKSVGMGVMDLAIGEALVNLAQQKGVGESLPAL
ncbi:shikimate/quinate 5-dehydrogenase [Aaosphaeria arxii CBS 175.79]|uniref:Shikimate/quinate 5-dehydrogenase n=1 Tax=Aaosphaeria arxii CBS 175.79 TaxID=1450172 RepID=A0A6A5XPR3_9PLEO|nr:shikimate/quinate 5-dehydrogenase [Aaosphaeria arxii CBS 175.79]KAF2014827.1 shikimate/quinate 5-dehydrogenase [Aaosphaeria arxii CBS 175.79]